MSNIKVVKINNLLEKKKTKKNNSNLEYLKNIIRKKEPPKLNKSLSKVLTKNEEIEKLLAKKKYSLKNTTIQKKTEITKQPTISKPVIQRTITKQPTISKPVIQRTITKQPKNKLPRLIEKLKPATRKDLNKFFKKKSKQKKIIASNIIAPKIKRRNTKKNNKLDKNIISSNHTIENHYTKVIQKVIKKNSSKLSKDIDKITRKQLIERLTKLDLINKDTKAPLNILQDIYKIYKITENCIDIKKNSIDVKKNKKSKNKLFFSK
jgi:hypothetical protein